MQTRWPADQPDARFRVPASRPARRTEPCPRLRATHRPRPAPKHRILSMATVDRSVDATEQQGGQSRPCPAGPCQTCGRDLLDAGSLCDDRGGPSRWLCLQPRCARLRRQRSRVTVSSPRLGRPVSGVAAAPRTHFPMTAFGAVSARFRRGLVTRGCPRCQLIILSTAA